MAHRLLLRERHAAVLSELVAVGAERQLGFSGDSVGRITAYLG